MRLHKIDNLTRLSTIFLVSSGMFLSAWMIWKTPQVQGVDCDTLEGEQKKECQELEEKQEKYEKLLKINQQQQNTLQNTISLLDAENDKIRGEIASKAAQVSSLENQIKRIDGQVTEYETSLRLQQSILRDLLQVYYQGRRDREQIAFFSAENFSTSFRQEDRVGQTEDKLTEMAENLFRLKQKLEMEKNTLAGKKSELEETQDVLEEKSDSLEVNKQQKQVLMQKTKGDEQEYQKMLAKIEQQKQELINIDELSIEDGLSADDYEKPTSGLASTSWYYSQRDSRWGNEEIGRSRSKMKDWGCAVSSVAMTFKYHGSSITPKTLANSNQYFSWDLIVWPKSWSSPSLSLVSSYIHGNINWTTIDSELKKNNTVIIYIKKTNGGGGHYVVIHHKVGSKYVVHDPYFGPNLYLDTSRSLVGKIGADSGTKMDQMIIYHKN